MAVSTQYLEFIKDHLDGAGDVTIRKMFGGAGVYSGGVMFGLIADETLYFRTDDRTAWRYADEGGVPFTYEPPPPRKPVEMPYWRVPERLFEDPEDMARWAGEAIAVARRVKAAAAERKVRRRKTD